MNDQEILAIAERYGTSQTRHKPTYHLHSGEPTGETYPQTDWDFGQEDLLAFAQEIRARLAEKEDEPAAWLAVGDGKVGLRAYLHKENALDHTKNIEPLYRHPPRPTGLDQLLERIRFLEQQIAEKNQ